MNLLQHSFRLRKSDGNAHVFFTVEPIRWRHSLKISSAMFFSLSPSAFLFFSSRCSSFDVLYHLLMHTHTYNTRLENNRSWTSHANQTNDRTTSVCHLPFLFLCFFRWRWFFSRYSNKSRKSVFFSNIRRSRAMKIKTFFFVFVFNELRPMINDKYFIILFVTIKIRIRIEYSQVDHWSFYWLKLTIDKRQ